MLSQDTKQLNRHQLREYAIESKEKLAEFDFAETSLQKRRRELEFDVGKALKFHTSLAVEIEKEN
jgi:hypothetical protein